MTKHNGVHLVQLGCSKNSVDGERFLGMLEQRGVAVANSSRNASAVVVNTCGFIDAAREEAIDEILKAIQLKNAGKIDEVYVIGCLATRSKHELAVELPEVDGIYGVEQWNELVQKLTNDTTPISLRDVLPRHYLTPRHSAFLRIADGCNRGCSYCAIPLMRGKYASTPLDNVLREAEQLKKRGVKECIVIAQELNDYGRDLGEPKLIEKLLRELDRFDFPWLRLLYTHPPAFDDWFIAALASSKTMVPYVDFPIEHSHPDILWSMGRKKRPEVLLHWISELRKAVREVVIRTSVIVGYPGEGEEEFQHLHDFIEETAFERLGAFLYSPEEDTRAFKIASTAASREIAEERRERILDLGYEIANRFHESKLGNTEKVLIEARENGHVWGRTKWDAPEIDYRVDLGESPLRVGSFVEVKLTEAWEGGWRGNAIRQPMTVVA